MPKVVVFGGSGFLGSHVADALTEAGYRVRIYDKTPSPYLREGQEMWVGDILDPEAVGKATRGADYVYNFAGIADLDDASTRPRDTVELNVTGNTHILDASVKSRVKRFIYASSIYVYSEKGGFYRCSKQASELYIEEYQRRYGLDFTIVRYSTLYGTRASERNSVYRYLLEAKERSRIVCHGSGEEMREYINVKDAARLSVEILNEKYRNGHIIVSGHHPIRFKEMLLMIQEILGKNIEIKFSGKANLTHYDYTPYSFTPKIGYRLTADMYLDMGQGLLECLAEIDRGEKDRELSSDPQKRLKSYILDMKPSLPGDTDIEVSSR